MATYLLQGTLRTASLVADYTVGAIIVMGSLILSPRDPWAMRSRLIRRP